MSGLVADTSALMAILYSEPDEDIFLGAFNQATFVVMSAASVFEAHCVACRSKQPDMPVRMTALLEEISPEIVPFDEEQLAAAREAYTRYGRGSKHPANLNIGDCFSYALARTRNLPLLFKGDDFVHTDIEPAIAAG